MLAVSGRKLLLPQQKELRLRSYRISPSTFSIARRTILHPRLLVKTTLHTSRASRTGRAGWSNQRCSNTTPSLRTHHGALRVWRRYVYSNFAIPRASDAACIERPSDGTCRTTQQLCLHEPGVCNLYRERPASSENRQGHMIPRKSWLVGLTMS